MRTGDPINLEQTMPSHCLGQYNAWQLGDDPSTPFDLVWISIAKAVAPHAHRVLPHGEPSLTIRRQRDPHGNITDIGLTICGSLRRAMWYYPEPREELISIRLKPEMAAPVYGVAPGEYFDQDPVPAPTALINACSATLLLAETGHPMAIAEQLARDLNHWTASRDIKQTPEIAAAAILRKGNGRTSCTNLARHLNVSERHLRRRFRDHLGCSPKFYARQLRLTAAGHLSEQTTTPDWAQIAAATGFHDQAHMINEFQSLADLTPQQFHKERMGLSVFSNT